MGVRIFDIAALHRAMLLAEGRCGRSDWRIAQPATTNDQGQLQALLKWRRSRGSSDEAPGAEAAVGGAESLNRFLRSRGFGPQVGDVGGKNIAAALVSQIFLSWPTERSKPLPSPTNDAVRYRGFVLGGKSFEVYRSGQQRLVQVVATRGSDLWLSPLHNSGDVNDMLLLQLAQSLYDMRERVSKPAGGLHLPECTIEDQRTLDWVHRARLGDTALQPTWQCTRMTIGAHGGQPQPDVDSTAAPLVFNRPFMFWLMPDGKPTPQLVGCTSASSWQLIKP